MRLRCSAACSPGLEPLVVAELAEIGVRAGPAPARSAGPLRSADPHSAGPLGDPAASAGPGRPRSTGLVAFTATVRQLYAACLRSSVASRVLVQVARFPARTFAELEREAAAVDWAPWTSGGGTFQVTAVKSRLFHTGAVAERLERLVGGGMPPAVAGWAPTPFVVRLDHDHVTISADAGGDPLHRRGWRLATAKAPLRPTLAAAALRTVGWDGSSPLIDPFCGSGTIAIEAAGVAAGLAPGRLRPFAFQAWPSFAPGTWASVVGELRARPALLGGGQAPLDGGGDGAAGRAGAGAPALGQDRHSLAGGGGAAPSEAAGAVYVGPASPTARPVTVLAADRDAGACAAARANAERARVHLDLRQQDLGDLEPPDGPPGWLVTNPPWGGRTGASTDLAELYAELGQVVAQRMPGWGVALLVADPRLAQATGLPLRHRWSTLAGGTRAHLFATPTREEDDGDSGPSVGLAGPNR